jgi:hypothetical protein
MRTRPYLVLGLMATFAALSIAADPPDPGKVNWAKDYPKAIAAKPGEAEGAIEVSGDYEVKPGWAIKEVQFYVVPKAGGTRSEITTLNLGVGSKWGALDPKDKTKVVPARRPVAKGEWTVWILFHFEGKDVAGKQVTVPWLAKIKTVEVK